MTDNKFRDGANPARDAQNSSSPMVPAPPAALNVITEKRFAGGDG